MKAQNPHNLSQILGLASSIRKRASREVVYNMAWLPTQLEYLKHPDDGTRYLFRAGNRQGKTTVGAAEVIYRARGVHPYKTLRKKTPTKIAVINFSKTQSIPIQEIIWGMVDRTELVEGTRFSPKVGFGGHKVVLQFKNGSTIQFFTVEQGAEALAGSEFDYIWIDEPPTRSIYEEAANRVLNTGGCIGITLTPINLPEPIEWLEELIEAKIVKEYHMKLTPESQISPLTGRVRVDKNGEKWDSARIEKLISETISIDRDIRLHGEWRRTVVGQFFNKFDLSKSSLEKSTIMTMLNTPGIEVDYFGGVDFAGADREAGLVFSLTARLVESGENGIKEKSYICLDEVVLSGSSTLSKFAREIIQCLQRWNLTWGDITSVWADNPVFTRAKIMSKTGLEYELVKIMNKRALYPPILSVKEGGGASSKTNSSVYNRCSWLYGEIETSSFYISSHCKWTIEALQKWEYEDTKSEYKDILDSLMYSFKEEWARKRRSIKAQTILV